MSNRGTITGMFEGGWRSQYMTFRCDWEVTSQDLTNKTSTVVFNFISTRTASDQETRDSNTLCTETIGSDYTEWYQAFDIRPYAVNEDYLVWTTTKTVSHASDGTASLRVIGTIDLTGTSAGYGSLDDYISLPRIATTPPTAVLTVSDVSSPKINGYYVATKSIIKLSCTATAHDGAIVSSIAWYRDGVMVGGGTATNYTFNNPETAGSHTYSAVVTDSYGLSTTVSSTIDVFNYIMPSIGFNEVVRCNSAGIEDAQGSYVKVLISVIVKTIYDVSSQTLQNFNVPTASVKVNNIETSIALQESYYEEDRTVEYVGYVIVNAGISPLYTYDVESIAIDALGSSAKKTDWLLTEFVDFSLHPNGGVAFGELAEMGKAKFNYDVKLESGKTFTIGSTTLTESQLQALLALLT